MRNIVDRFRPPGHPYTHEDAVVIALVAEEAPVDWSVDEPDTQYWLPESIFEEIQGASRALGLPTIADLNVYAQSLIGPRALARLSAELETLESGSLSVSAHSAVRDWRSLVGEAQRSSPPLVVLIEGP